jgi:RNA polymerase sigma-70 factor (ECF subfamily)
MYANEKTSAKLVYFAMKVKTAQNNISETELELLRKAQHGDEKAFTELYRRYNEMVFSFALKVCRNKEKAEETLQDTFINVYRKLHQFKGTSKFSSWLYSIVTNNCLMKHRAEKTTSAAISLEENFLDGEEPISFSLQEIFLQEQTPSEILMKKELQKKLDEAILQLPIEYRLVFILRDLEGQSAEETAKIMKITVPATKSRLRRARLFLQEQLNDYRKH